MKKNVILITFLALFCFKGRAQAPDFTATDINGTSWHLYELLDAGKTVIIDFSATWCHPCWNYHHEDVLKNLYNTFGPDGSDQIMVFFVESDYSTTSADLHGTGTNTQGDWVTGTPYPILDQSSVEDLFSIPGFPTLYTICPDRSMEQTNRQTFDEYVNTLMTQCSNSVAGNLDVIATPLIGDLSYAQGCGSISPKIDILNIGVTPVTSAEVELRINGLLVETQSCSGLLNTSNRGSVFFGAHSINEGDLIEITIAQINGGADDVPTNNTWSYTIESIAPTIILSNELTFELMTDTTPDETSWDFKSTDGTILASATSYPLDGTLYTQTITLPEDGCYQLGVYDSFGDGLYPTGAFYRLSSGSTVLAEGVEFEYLVEHLFNFQIQAGGGGGGSASIESETLDLYTIYPNPTKGKIQINLKESNTNTSYTLTSAAGNIVSHTVVEKIDDHQEILDLSGNAPGLYFLKISNGTEVKTEKIILQ